MFELTAWPGDHSYKWQQEQWQRKSKAARAAFPWSFSEVGAGVCHSSPDVFSGVETLIFDHLLCVSTSKSNRQLKFNKITTNASPSPPRLFLSWASPRLFITTPSFEVLEGKCWSLPNTFLSLTGPMSDSSATPVGLHFQTRFRFWPCLTTFVAVTMDRGTILSFLISMVS